MYIKELTVQAFKLFASNSSLESFMQSEEYARLMGECGYNYDYIGLVDENDTIIAASLILWKKIGIKQKYGYAPKGFLLNYYDENILKEFTEKIKEYYHKKGFTFIKVNPEIVVGSIDNKTLEFKHNPNLHLKSSLPNYGYRKLKDNLYFEAMVPRFNAYIDLKASRFEKFSKMTRNKVNNSLRKGLYYEKGSINDIKDFYTMLNLPYKEEYVRNAFDIFNKAGKADLILIKVDYEKFIKNSQNLYEEELDVNGLYNEILHRSSKANDLNKKMNSDTKLCVLKNEIINATEGLRTNNNQIVAGAIIIKDKSRAHIFASGFNRKFANLNSNYFLYNSLINVYKKDFSYLDIGPISGDFKVGSKYHNLNRFKLGFNPIIYEFIGEFDLVINKINYEYLLASGKLANEFNEK